MNDKVTNNVKDLIPEVGYRAKPSQTLQSILKAHRLHYERLADIPPEVAREIQRRPVFADFRSIEMTGETIRESLTRPILKDLLVTRIGYCSRAAGHFIPRPEGSLDHVLHYCVDGKGWCEMAGRRWTIGPETVLLIPAGVPHCYGAAARTPWSIHWIHFTGRSAAEYCRLLGVTAETPLFQLPATDEILSAFEACYQRMNSVHTHGQLIAATGNLARLLGLANLERHSVNLRTSTAERNLKKTAQFMKENIAGRYSLLQFAQIAHLSTHHYCSLFKTRYGFSPIEYFNRLKMAKAQELLLNTTLQVRQVGRSLSFDDPYYFSRLFRKIVGVSPKEYRKQKANRDGHHELTEPANANGRSRS
ncbi:MAG: AraC family ligand binding domain-containing protein [Pirellulales bacterium]|nr:AraC family ligand binding domain-containing protein [Pirellulales bacterium]